MANGVLFNFIPGSGVIAPGNFFEVNSGGTFESVSRVVLGGHCAAAGSLADNTPTICTTIDEAASLCGAGSQLYEMFRVMRMNAPVQEIWLSKVPITGSIATWTVTVGAGVTAGGVGVLEIAGRAISVSVAATETANNVASTLTNAINAWFDPLTKAYLPVTATVAGAVVTLTARHPGMTMNEIEIVAPTTAYANLFGGTVLTIAQTVTATDNATLNAFFANLGEEPFDWIVTAFGDATHFATADAALSDVSGRWAWNVQHYGHYFAAYTGNTAQHTTFGLARNSRHTSPLARYASPTPSWECIAGYVGRMVPWLSDSTNGNAARNMSDLAIEGVRAPRSRLVWPGYATRNSLLANGMSTFKVNSTGEVCIDKCITSSRTNAQGLPDSTFRDIQSIAQVVHGLRYLRAGLSYKHANRALADQNPGNLPTISTPDDIKGDVISLYGNLVDRGLFENKEAFARALVVKRDASNPARVNVGMSLDRVNPLDVIAANATIYAQIAA